MDTVCRAGKVAGYKYITGSLLPLAKMLVTSGMGPLFASYGYGGKAVVAITGALVTKSFGGSFSDAVVRDLTVQFGEQLGKQLLGAYLDIGVGALASWTIQEAEEAMGLDGIQSDSASEIVVPIHLGGAPGRTSVSFAYNPFTHFVTAFLASELDLAHLYIVSYQIDDTGERAVGGETTFATYAP